VAPEGFIICAVLIFFDIWDACGALTESACKIVGLIQAPEPSFKHLDQVADGCFLFFEWQQLLDIYTHRLEDISEEFFMK